RRAVGPPLRRSACKLDDGRVGLSTAYGLSGHEFVTGALTARIGRRDGVVGEIRAELAGRPESL
ncbi:hypothetical protein, partial [Streptomyces hayashii]|uniref:hypothetical protein n=1 Tax=Streptomyces hayashii TaxID=2839966 RepID=UPI00403CB061